MEKDPLTDALRYHPSSQLLSTRHLFPPTENRYVPPHFLFPAFFPHKAWTINFRAPAPELELNFALPAQVEIGAFVLISPSFFYIFVPPRCRGVQRLAESRGNRLFSGRLALLSLGGKRRYASRFPSESLHFALCSRLLVCPRQTKPLVNIHFSSQRSLH